MNVIVVRPEVQSDQVLVRHQQDAFLLEAVAVEFREVARVEEFFVVFEGLPHV